MDKERLSRNLDLSKRFEQYGSSKNMVELQLKIIKDNIKDYSAWVREQTFSSDFIVEHRAEIGWRLNYLKGKIDITAVEKELKQIDVFFGNLKKSNKDYESNLIQGLSSSLDRYCWYLSSILEWFSEELEDMFGFRDNIEVISNGISKHKIKGLLKRINEADIVLKKYAPVISEIITSTNLDSLFPKSFWWRRLKEKFKKPLSLTEKQFLFLEFDIEKYAEIVNSEKVNLFKILEWREHVQWRLDFLRGKKNTSSVVKKLKGLDSKFRQVKQDFNNYEQQICILRDENLKNYLTNLDSYPALASLENAVFYRSRIEVLLKELNNLCFPDFAEKIRLGDSKLKEILSKTENVPSSRLEYQKSLQPVIPKSFWWNLGYLGK